MFVLKQSPTYKWPVSFALPSDGKLQDHTITVEFKRYTNDELVALTNDPEITDIKIAKASVVGWDGVDTPFSPEALAELLQQTPVPTAIVLALLDSAQGSAKRKN